MWRTADAAVLLWPGPCPFPSRCSSELRGCLDDRQPKLAGDRDGVRCRLNLRGAKANKHGALALKVGARSLMASGEAGRSGRCKVGANGGASKRAAPRRPVLGRLDFGAFDGAALGAASQSWCE